VFALDDSETNTEFGVLYTAHLDPPGFVCWQCMYGYLAPELTVAADAGNASDIAAVQQWIFDNSLLLPLWRDRVVVAWGPGLEGVVVNGYAPAASWNAWEWWRSDLG
jgi:hypothetical protein